MTGTAAHTTTYTSSFAMVLIVSADMNVFDSVTISVTTDDSAIENHGV